MREIAGESQKQADQMPPWSQIDTVMFDMDGTLLDLHFDNYFWQQLVPQAWGQQQGVEAAQASLHLQEMYSSVHGTLNWYCLDFWTEQLQLDITGLKQQIKDKIAIRPNVTSLLARLRSLQKRTLLITNAHPDSLALKLEQTGIGEYFDNTVSAHSLKLAKENHGFWQALLELEHYDPDRTLLIDDSLPVLRQAEREGIRYLYGIYQPDSRQDPLIPEKYPQIIDFDHIMPARRPDEMKSPPR